jgi:hypothetical protein
MPARSVDPKDMGVEMAAVRPKALQDEIVHPRDLGCGPGNSPGLDQTARTRCRAATGSKVLDGLEAPVEAEIKRIRSLGIDEVRALWRTTMGSASPPALTKDLIVRIICWRIQEKAFGGLDRATVKLLGRLAQGQGSGIDGPRHLKAGTVLVREYQGERHTVTIVPDGFVWREQTYRSLSTIARAITGTAWNGPRFFGLRVPSERSGENDGEQRRIGPGAADRTLASPEPVARVKANHSPPRSGGAPGERREAKR